MILKTPSNFNLDWSLDQWSYSVSHGLPGACASSRHAPGAQVVLLKENVPKNIFSKNVLSNIQFNLKPKKSDILTKTKTFGRSWPLLILYLGHFTYKKNDINLKWPFFSIAKEISLDQRSLACKKANSQLSDRHKPATVALNLLVWQ